MCSISFAQSDSCSYLPNRRTAEYQFSGDDKRFAYSCSLMLSMKIVTHFQPSLRCCRLSYGVQQFCQHFLHKSAGFRLHVCPCTEHTRERSCTAADQILYGMGIGFTLQNVENGIGQLFSLLRFHAQDPLPQRGIQQLTGVGGILGIVPVIPDHTPRVWIVLQKTFLCAVNYLIFLVMLQQHAYYRSLWNKGIHSFLQLLKLRLSKQVCHKAWSVIVIDCTNPRKVFRLHLDGCINCQIAAFGVSAHIDVGKSQ